MIHIDLPADLHFEDDDGFVLARVPATGAPHLGSVLVAGGTTSWTWALVEGVEDGWVKLRVVTAREAAKHGSLIAS